MKNNLLSLIKIELAKFLSSFNSKGKKASKTPLMYVVGLILLAIIAASFGYSFLILNPYVSIGADTSSVISLFAGATSMLIFMSAMSQTRAIYIGDDYDLLTTLPIKKRTIVAAKIISLYVVELSFSLLVMLPHAIMQIAYAHNVTCCLLSLLLAFTLPIVPIAVAILISFLVTIATAKFKSANFIFTILYALVIIGFSGMIMIFNNLKADKATSGFASIGNVIKWVNPSYRLVELSLDGNNWYLLIFGLVNIALAIFSILFIAIFFDRLHEIVSSVSMKKDYVRKDLKSKSQAKTLLDLEFKRLVNSKVYFLNAIIGSVMAILASTVFIITFTQSINGVSEEHIAAKLSMEALFVPIFVITVCLVIGITNPTTGCINIEGKNFWLIKSLPIDYKKYMKVKLLFCFTLTIPAALIASTICVIFFHRSALEIAMCYVIPLLYTVLNSLIGLIVAIHHPKLKWNNEAEAVKNSASVFIALIIDFGIMIAFSAAMILIPLLLPMHYYLAYVIMGGVILISIIPCALYLKNSFAKRIQAIEEL